MDMNWHIHWQARSTRKDKRDVPFGNQGEAHAGWFQGKVEALYNEELRQHANKKCEDFFRSSEFDKLDLKRYTNDGEYAKQFSYGAGWYKLWYIWQRFSNGYGGNISSIPVGKTTRCDF